MKPTLYIFSMFGCPACINFEAQVYPQLVQDRELLSNVDLVTVKFGTGPDGISYTLEEFPDIKVEYAPLLYLTPPYDEKSGAHLDPVKMHDPIQNPRAAGKIYEGERELAAIRRWTSQGSSGKRVNTLFKKMQSR